MFSVGLGFANAGAFFASLWLWDQAISGFSRSSVNWRQELKSELAINLLKHKSISQNFNKTKRVKTIKLKWQASISGFMFLEN